MIKMGRCTITTSVQRTEEGIDRSEQTPQYTKSVCTQDQPCI